MSALSPRIFRFQIVVLLVTSLLIVGISVASFGSTEPGWVTVDADKQIDDRVSLDEELGVYLVKRGDRTIAFANHGPWNDELVVYCESSQMFETPRSGSKFDVYGHYYGGPAPRGMSRYRTLADGDAIKVFIGELVPGLGRSASKKRVLQPVGPFCIAY